MQQSIKRSLTASAGLFMAAAFAAGGEALAQAPQNVFTGCEDAVVISNAGASPRERINEAASRTDPVTERVFKSFSIDEVSGVDAPEFNDLCWSRLDGVWREQMRISFDRALKADGWAAESPSLLEFAHGSYTTPLHISVQRADNYDKEIVLRSALTPGAPVRFVSADGLKVADTLRDSSKRKTYRSETINGRSETLTLDVTRSGYVRLQLGDRIFLRPRPDISKADAKNQVGRTDIFAVAYNPKNMRASRQGYDVTTQNPNRFLDNGGKLDVFAPAAARDYYITEQMTVPLGLKLLEEGSQGTVFFERLMSSESDIQEANSSSYGVNLGVGSKNNKNRNSRSNGEKASGNDNAGRNLAFSAGVTHAQSEFNAMRESKAVSSIVGFQRYKKYALVRDHPFSNLSDAFIDAIDDAKHDGNYQRLIDRFGTHYPYAVTYGSAGHLKTHMTESSFSQNFGSFTQTGKSGGFELGPVEFSANMESSKDLKQGSTVSSKFGETTFTAVGGNGSWSEAGFIAGDAPYPILMDLRPLDALLNPMNFPDEPDIYERVRDEFAAAIAGYLEGKSQLVSNESLLEEVERPEKWLLHVFLLACDSAGGRESDRQLELGGSITFKVLKNPGNAKVQNKSVLTSTYEKPLYLSCAKGRRKLNFKQVIEGTRMQLRKVTLGLYADMTEYDYADFLDPDDSVKGRAPFFAIPDSRNHPVGESVKKGWRMPHSDGAVIGLHWTLTRIE